MSIGRKKSYEIIKSSERSKDIKGLLVGAGRHRKMKFDKHGRMIVHDAGVAKEIDQKYGHKGGSKDVVVVEVDDLRPEHRGTKTGARKVWNIRVPWRKDE
ncbi:MAG: hypothetical protein ACXABY_37625 [Candidatus Thorarchaeota archaeon]|jgi:hypothetical protein